MRSRSIGRPYGNDAEKPVNGERSSAPGEEGAKRPSVQTQFAKPNSSSHLSPTMSKPPDPSTANTDKTRDPRLHARTGPTSMQSPHEFKKAGPSNQESAIIKSPMSGAQRVLPPTANLARGSVSVSGSEESASLPTILRDLIHSSIEVAQAKKIKKNTDSYLTKTEKRLETVAPFPALYEQEKKSLKDASAESTRLGQQMQVDQAVADILTKRFLQSLSHSQKPPSNQTDGVLTSRIDVMEAEFLAFKERASKTEKEQRLQLRDQESEISNLRSELRNLWDKSSDSVHRIDSIVSGIRTDLSLIQKTCAESEVRTKESDFRTKAMKHTVEQLSSVKATKHSLDQISTEFAGTQEATKNSLDELSKRLADLEDVCKTVQMDVGKIQTDHHGLQEKLDQAQPVKIAEKELISRIGEHATVMEALKVEMSSTSRMANSRHEELEGRLNRLSESVISLESKRVPTENPDEKSMEDIRKDITAINGKFMTTHEQNEARDQAIADYVEEEVAKVAQRSDVLQERLAKLETNITNGNQVVSNQIRVLTKRFENSAATRVMSPNTIPPTTPHNSGQQTTPTPIHRSASTSGSAQAYNSRTLAPPPPQHQPPSHPQIQNCVPAASSPHNDPIAARFTMIDNHVRALNHAMKDMNARLANYTSQQVFNAILNAVLSRTKVKDLERIPALELRNEQMDKKMQDIEAKQSSLQNSNAALSNTVQSFVQKLNAYVDATQPRLREVEQTLARIPATASEEIINELKTQIQDLVSSVTSWKESVTFEITTWKDEVNTSTSTWKDRVDKDVRELLHDFTNSCSEQLGLKIKEFMLRVEDLEKQVKKLKKRQDPNIKSFTTSQHSTSSTPAPSASISHVSASGTPRTTTTTANSENEAIELLNRFQQRPPSASNFMADTSSLRSNGHTPLLSSRVNGSTTSFSKASQDPTSEIGDSEEDDNDDDDPLEGPRRNIKNDSRRIDSSDSNTIKSETGSRPGPFDPGPELRRAKLQKRKKDSAIDLVDTDNPADKDWMPGEASSTTTTTVSSKKENHNPKKRKTGL